MRAWQVQGAGEPIDVLHLVDVEPPQPESGQVRIRIEAAGIGLPDVLMCRGTYPLTPPLPFTSGQEATGTITATGDGVDLPIGARIMCVTAFTEGFGSFADECLVLQRGTIAWQGANEFTKPLETTVRLYVMTWDNPHPDKLITSIDFQSANTVCAPFCLAMTGE